MKAPFAYYGGKMGMAQRIVELMPPHRVYMEPFFGSGAVFFAKAPVHTEIINDLDGGVVAFFRALRDSPSDLERLCALTPHARDEFEACAVPSDDPLEQARRFWVRISQGFAQVARANTGWRRSASATKFTSIPDEALSAIERFAGCAQRLRRAAIENCDAVDLIERLANAETVVYVDPPYLADSRSAGSGSVSDYAVEMGGSDDHARLAAALRSTLAKVILSGYPSPLYDELYGDWHRIDVATQARTPNPRNSAWGERTEVLWTNYEPMAGQLNLGAC